MDEKITFTQKIVPAFLYAVRHQDKLGNDVIKICNDLEKFTFDFSKNNGREKNGKPSLSYIEATNILNKNISNIWTLALENKEKISELYQKHKEEIFFIAHLNSQIKNPETSTKEIKYPALKQMVSGLSRSITKWAVGGFKIVDERIFEQRLDQCRLCEFWDSKALNGGGRCKKCGCSTWAKLKLATEKCPIGKW